jgi:hypothetical protein
MLTRGDLKDRCSEIRQLLFQARELNYEAMEHLENLESNVCADLDHLHKRNAELIVQANKDAIDSYVPDGSEAA